jgi:hypothetical protein
MIWGLEREERERERERDFDWMMSLIDHSFE